MFPRGTELTSRPPAALRYGVAVAASLLALGISALYNTLFGQNTVLLFFASIAIGSWYGGLRPGLVATVIGVLASAYYVLVPAIQANAVDTSVLVRMSLIILDALIINVLTEARGRAQADALSQGERLQVTLASIGDAVIATDLAGHITFMNVPAAALTGWTQAEALGRELESVFQIVNEETRAPVENPATRVLQEGQVVGLANHTILIAKDGTERPIDDSAAPIRGAGGRMSGVVLIFRDISERRRVEIERTRLLAAEQAARSEAEAGLRRLTFLAEVSAVLARSLDYETTLASVARLAVPEIADWCGLDVLQEDGTLEQLAVVHVDPDKVAWAKQLRQRFPPDPNAASGIYHVLRTQQPEILPLITDEMLVATIQDPEVLAIARAVGFTSVITMPIVARENALGVLTLVSAESHRRFGEADVTLADLLARRAAVAIDNARLYRAAQAERERFAVTLSSIGDAVIATDTAGEVTFMNAVAEELTGWPGADAGGQPLETVFRIINEQTRQTVENPASRVLREGRVVGLANHTILIARDGTESPIDDSGAPIRDDKGDLRGVVLVFRDIGERKEVERQQQFLTDMSAVLAASLDYEATVAQVARLAVPIIADNAVLDVLEDDGTMRRVASATVDPAREAALREVAESVPPDAAGIGVRQVLESGRPVLIPTLTPDFWARAPLDDTQRALAESFNAISLLIMPFQARGRILGSLTLGMAGSGRHYSEDDLPFIEEVARRAALAIDNARLYHSAQTAIQTRDQFLSIASHELRTPLTSVVAAAQLLQRRTMREGNLSPRDQRALQVVVDQTARLNRMVLSLLDLSRIETGQLSIERTPVDLTALLQRVVEEVQPTLDRHTIALEVPDAAVEVEGDALRLEQVVQNLIQNAAKYSPESESIGVALAVHDQEACVAVHDQGIGIPEAAQAHLFQRFYRAPNVEAYQIAGMGIGLFVVKEIVTLHGGHVDVQSSEGAGSTFTICLPLLPPDAQAEPAS